MVGLDAGVSAAGYRRAHLCVGRSFRDCCCGPPTKETRLSKVKAVSCSATIRAVPRLFTVRRIILAIFFYRNGCEIWAGGSGVSGGTDSKGNC
jgi:hypothetical protein